MRTVEQRRWARMARPARHAPLALLLIAMLFVPTLTSAAPLPGDLGDAPDSTNHAGVAMNAFPGILGRYPSVFDPVTGAPPGPVHINPLGNGWLGQSASRETDADLLPDADGLTNIAPALNAPNRDRLDDGVLPVSPTINLPQCGRTQFRYLVSGVAAPPVPANFVNVWIDFNRDGDWADTLTCTSGGVAIIVREWAVQNQPVVVAPGTVVWATPVFPTFHIFSTTATRDTWMRITLANRPVVTTMPTDGSGPTSGYQFGETEDYLLKYTGTGTLFQPS